MNATEFFQKLQSEFALDKQFQVERAKSFPDFAADLYVQREGKSLLGLLPYNDYFFFYNFDGKKSSKEQINELHEKARKFVNSLYKLPKAFRISVPNIATVVVADRFDDETRTFVSKRTRDFVGGEIHSLFLVELATSTIYSQDRESVRVNSQGMALNVLLNFDPGNISPINRAIETIGTKVAKVLS